MSKTQHPHASASEEAANAKDTFILVTGSPVNGLVFNGPFATAEDASAYAEANSTSIYGDSWWVAALDAPDVGEEP